MQHGLLFYPIQFAGKGDSSSMATIWLQGSAHQSCLNPANGSAVPAPKADATGNGLAGVSAQEESVGIGHNTQAQQQLRLREVLCSATGCEQLRM